MRDRGALLLGDVRERRIVPVTPSFSGRELNRSVGLVITSAFF